MTLRWQNRPPLLSHDWECKDSMPQMGSVLLGDESDDAESRSCQSLMCKPESYGHVQALQGLKSRRKWVRVEVCGDSEWCLSGVVLLSQ